VEKKGEYNGTVQQVFTHFEKTHDSVTIFSLNLVHRRHWIEPAEWLL